MRFSHSTKSWLVEVFVPFPILVNRNSVTVTNITVEVENRTIEQSTVIQQSQMQLQTSLCPKHLRSNQIYSFFLSP
jgi:hypothetical protein